MCDLDSKGRLSASISATQTLKGRVSTWQACEEIDQKEAVNSSLDDSLDSASSAPGKARLLD